ncbi:MAG: histidine phosphatase family protein [Clostridia bacterium]|nr:histidine phosphatase family protein [Clostridia bacterium]
MTTLIIVRHAQSLANKENRFIGHIDMDLSELGFKQAELLCEYLLKENFSIDAIYSSDLIRPYHTIEPYAKAIGMEITKEKRLREIYAGKWEGHKYVDLISLYPQNYNDWLHDLGNCKCDGGEAVTELYDRINSVIDEIAAKHEGQTVLIATHATPLRCLFARAKGVGTEGMKNIKWCENTSINIFEYSAGVLSAKKLNISEHLGQLRSDLPSTV